MLRCMTPLPALFTPTAAARRPSWIAAGTALAAAVLLAACAPAEPSDQVLLDRFARHKPQFEKLQTMLVADHGNYMNRRYDTYQKLRLDLGLQKFVGNGIPPTGLRFPAAMSDDTFQLTHGSTKGYAWLPHPPDVLAAAQASPSFGVTDDLDGQHLPKRPYIMALRHIEGPWYLYLDNDPFRSNW
jgi:hypothetical protein